MKKFFAEFAFEGAVKYRLLMLCPAAVLVMLDQLIKYLAVVFLKEKPPVVLIDGVFELLYEENPGAAFSILENKRAFFIILTSFVMLFLLLVILSGRYRRYPLINISFVLILSGGIGNLIDRCVNGYVVDYVYFKWINFPIFNFADSCLVIGAILMLIFFFFIYEDTSPKASKTAAKKDGSNGTADMEHT